MRRNVSIGEALGLAPKGHKYGAVKTVVDGIVFPSKREAMRYAELALLERSGDITCLEVDARLPIRYRLIVNGISVCTYRPDFRYREHERVIVDDAKGMRTPLFNLKAKLFRALYPDTELRIS